MNTCISTKGSASTPDGSGVEFATSADGLAVAHIGDMVLAMINEPEGGGCLGSALKGRRLLTQLHEFDFYRHDFWMDNEVGFRALVAEVALRESELAQLDRTQSREPSWTPWGGSQLTTIYGEGVVKHMAAHDGGFQISPERNAKVLPSLRKNSGWYEEALEWSILAISFPELFTTSERSNADDTIRDIWPQIWEEIHGRIPVAGESWAEGRANFERCHAQEFVVIAAVRSDFHFGMTEVVASMGGRRTRDHEKRRFLVPCDEYARRGRHGFVIVVERHQAYHGSSTFAERNVWEGRI